MEKDRCGPKLNELVGEKGETASKLKLPRHVLMFSIPVLFFSFPGNIPKGLLEKRRDGWCIDRGDFKASFINVPSNLAVEILHKYSNNKGYQGGFI